LSYTFKHLKKTGGEPVSTGVWKLVWRVEALHLVKSGKKYKRRLRLRVRTGCLVSQHSACPAHGTGQGVI